MTPARPLGLDLPARIADGGASFSFEFFPPKTEEGLAVLWRAIEELEPLAPTFVSVTYGAGGSTRSRTVAVTARIATESALTPVAHMTCVGATESELAGLLQEYERAGVSTVLALRGDPPGGPDAPWESTDGGLEHADALVALAAADGFTVGVAAFPEGHPQCTSLAQDAEVLAAKQDAGATFALTQFFFRADDYFALLERARRAGVTMPIVPGVMPVTNLSQIRRFAQRSGVEFPADLARRFEACADEDAVRALGIEAATELCATLLAGGAPGLHYFTLNRSSATRQIHANLGLAARAG